MPTTHTASATATPDSTITLPSDGDNAVAESIDAAAREIHDRTEYAIARIIGSIGPNAGIYPGLTLNHSDTGQLAKAIWAIANEAVDQRAVVDALGNPWQKLSSLAFGTSWGVPGFTAVAVSSKNNRALGSIAALPYNPIVAAVKTDTFYVGDILNGIHQLSDPTTGTLHAVAVVADSNFSTAIALTVGDSGKYYLASFNLSARGLLDGGTISGSPSHTELIWDPTSVKFFATGSGGVHRYNPYASPLNSTAWTQLTSVDHSCPVALAGGRLLFIKTSLNQIRYSDDAGDTFNNGYTLPAASVCTPVYDSVLGAAVFLTDTQIISTTDGVNHTVQGTVPSGAKRLFSLKGRAVVSMRQSRDGTDERIFITHDGTGNWFVVQASSGLENGDVIAGCREAAIIAQEAIYVSPLIKDQFGTAYP